MKFFAERALVLPSCVNKLTCDGKPEPPTEPLVNAMTSIEHKMKETLERPDMYEEDKVKLHNQQLRRYLQFYDKYNLPRQQPPGPSNSPPPSPTAIGRDNIAEELNTILPKTLKEKGQLLLNRLRSTEAVKWNEKGELILKGKPLKGTHITDLIGDVVRQKRKRSPPEGWEVFSKGLKQANIPLEFIGNKERYLYSTTFAPDFEHRTPWKHFPKIEEDEAMTPRRKAWSTWHHTDGYK